MKVNRQKLELAMARACMNSADLPAAAGLPRPTVFQDSLNLKTQTKDIIVAKQTRSASQIGPLNIGILGKPSK